MKALTEEFTDGVRRRPMRPLAAGPRRCAWYDQAKTPARGIMSVSSPQAGYLDIERASPIICASTTLTTSSSSLLKKAYNSVAGGMPYIYEATPEIGNNCAPWSPQSISNATSGRLDVEAGGILNLDGTSFVPANWLRAPVGRRRHRNLLQMREQARRVHVGDFGEVWWFFPQDRRAKNTRCIYFSYKEGWWGMGQMARTAGITSSLHRAHHHGRRPRRFPA